MSTQVLNERVPVNLHGDTKESVTVTGWQPAYQAYRQAFEAHQRGEDVNLNDFIWSKK